jgi:nitrite reductase (NO-forming)
MPMKWILLGAAVVIVVLFLVFRGGQQGESPGAGGAIAMRAGDFFFSPKSLTVAVDEEVILDIRSTGTHTFTIDELGVNVRFGTGPATVRFTPDRAGQFEFYCAIPGHRERGMFGSVIVEEES